MWTNMINMTVTLVVTVVLMLEAVLLIVVLLVGVVVVVTAVEAMWARAIINTFVEVLTVDMWADVLIDTLTDTILGSLTNIGADDANVNVFAGVMTSFEFAMPDPFEEFRCWAAFDCRSMTVLECISVSQAWMPSYQVWSGLALPALPQCPNQKPPWPQQLIFPDFATMPHLGHTELVVVVLADSVYMWALVKTQRWKRKNQSLEDLSAWR